MKHIGRERSLIFASALTIKMIFAAVFFGSIDFIVSLGQATSVISGQTFNVPYFPAISAYLWLSALLAGYTPLPLALCFKLVPALASSLSAVIIYDITQRRWPQRAFIAAMLFALSPVTLIVDSLHFQWDSVVLFFLLLSFYARDFFDTGYKNFFLSGAFFALAFLVKPYSLMFGLFAASPLRGFPGGFASWLKKHLVWVLGFVTITAVSFLILSEMGYNILERWRFINEYGNVGIVIFGLPKTGVLADYPFLQQRMSVLSIMALLVIPYHLRWIGIFEVVGVSFTLCLTFLGLAPQYLGWSIPFLILAGSYRGVGIYSLVAGVFLALYYANPQASFMPHENMATFAPLKIFSWLTPTILFWDAHIVGGIRLIGNYLVPLFALVSLTILVTQIIFSKEQHFSGAQRASDKDFSSGWLGWAFGPFILAFFLWGILSIERAGAAYGHAVSEKTKSYSMQIYDKNTYFQQSIPSEGSPFNVVNILIFLSGAWSIGCFQAAKRAP